MIIAIDYDDTYTQDPELWNNFIKSSNERGHVVICVTMRYGTGGEEIDVLNSIGKLCGVIFTGRRGKRNWVKESNIYPDVWIDDRPEYILNNSVSYNGD
jgi:hypothetical protein